MKVALFRSKGVIAALIRWQTRSPYSHAALIAPDGSVYESREFHGVRHLPFEEAKGESEVDIFDVFTTPSQEATILNFAAEAVGLKYDYSSIFRFLTRQKPEADSSFFCSEFVFSAFQAAGINLLERISPAAVSPAHLSLSPLLESKS